MSSEERLTDEEIDAIADQLSNSLDSVQDLKRLGRLGEQARLANHPAQATGERGGEPCGRCGGKKELVDGSGLFRGGSANIVPCDVCTPEGAYQKWLELPGNVERTPGGSVWPTIFKAGWEAALSSPVKEGEGGEGKS